MAGDVVGLPRGRTCQGDACKQNTTEDLFHSIINQVKEVSILIDIIESQYSVSTEGRLSTHNHTAGDVAGFDDIVSGREVDDSHIARLSRERFDNLTGDAVDNDLDF